MGLRHIIRVFPAFFPVFLWDEEVFALQRVLRCRLADVTVGVEPGSLAGAEPA
jgi:hypothetical protein